MKKTAIALICTLSFSATAYQRHNWMADLPNDRSLAEIVIPGTHDTGAYRIPADLGETQDWSINEQLVNGIRFLDVRIANSSTSAYPFEIRHGFERLGNFHDLIMNPTNNFLNANPNEVIIMSVSDEDTLDKQRFMNEVVNAPGSKFVTHVDTTVNLGDVRGKIILMDRMALNTEIQKLALRSGSLIDSVIVNDQNYGGLGGGLSPTLNLAKGEYVNRVAVQSGSLVDHLTFTTNFGNVVDGGGAGGGHHLLDNIKLVSITGKHGSLLDQITLHYTRPNDATLYSSTYGGNGGGDFGPKRAGIRWGNPSLHIQDNYNLSNHCSPVWYPPFVDCSIDYPAKANDVVNHLNGARNAQGFDWWINFASANWQGLYIGNSAEVSNAAVNNYFRDLVNRKANGEDIKAFGSIIPMDYPNRQGDYVISSILDFNFSANWSGAVTPEQSCGAEGQFASQNSNTPRLYTFFNKSNETRRYQWLDYAGNRVQFVELAPNAATTVNSYATHPFVVTDTNNVCKGVYVIGANDGKLFNH